jgi:hypothetical protein
MAGAWSKAHTEGGMMVDQVKAVNNSCWQPPQHCPRPVLHCDTMLHAVASGYMHVLCTALFQGMQDKQTGHSHVMKQVRHAARACWCCYKA